MWLTTSYVTVPVTGVTPGPVRVKVDVVIVVWSMASLKVTARVWLRGTSVAELKGTVETTVGAEVSAAPLGVNLQTKLVVNPFPARSRARVVIVAVYIVFDASALAGIKIAVVPA